MTGIAAKRSRFSIGTLLLAVAWFFALATRFLSSHKENLSVAAVLITAVIAGAGLETLKGSSCSGYLVLGCFILLALASAEQPRPAILELSHYREWVRLLVNLSRPPRNAMKSFCLVGLLCSAMACLGCGAQAPASRSVTGLASGVTCNFAAMHWGQRPTTPFHQRLTPSMAPTFRSTAH